MKVICGDCVEKMSEMEDGSIHLVVTSPPYDNLRTYHGFSWDFEKMAKQIYRVLCDGGYACWNVADATIDGSETLTSFKQAIFFKEECGFKMHDTMIYERPGFTNPMHTRYHSVFEYVFILLKGDAPRCFNPIRDRPNRGYGNDPCITMRNTFRQADGSMKPRKNQHEIKEFGMRYNIWRGPSRTNEDVCTAFKHPAMMPKWLARDLIISWSNEGDTVLDPFAGSFTTCIEAEQIGRKAIGIDISEEYCELGRNAIIKPQQFEFPENGAQQ